MARTKVKEKSKTWLIFKTRIEELVQSNVELAEIARTLGISRANLHAKLKAKTLEADFYERFKQHYF